jgi:hypothetical protein
MINAWLELPDTSHPYAVYCPKCGEEAQLNKYYQIECDICEEYCEFWKNAGGYCYDC